MRPERLTCIIKTDQLDIHPLTIVNAAHIATLNNRHYMRYSEQRRQRHDTGTELAYIAAASDSFWPLNLWACLRSRSAGTMSCHIDHANRIVDLGIMVSASMARSGYGSEAWIAVTNYWLGHGYKVECGCHEGNEAMLALTLYAEMIYEGRREDHFRNDDGSRSASYCTGKHVEDRHSWRPRACWFAPRPQRRRAWPRGARLRQRTTEHAVMAGSDRMGRCHDHRHAEPTASP